MLIQRVTVNRQPRGLQVHGLIGKQGGNAPTFTNQPFVRPGGAALRPVR